MRALMSGAAVFALAAFAFAMPASAQCWWNGAYWRCDNQAYSYPYYGNDWGQFAPNWYQAHPGNKPAWLPSYPGPRPSGGAGR